MGMMSSRIEMYTLSAKNNLLEAAAVQFAAMSLKS
jgi:hypothetical protein